jgi:hypothetical protein
MAQTWKTVRVFVKGGQHDGSDHHRLENIDSLQASLSQGPIQPDLTSHKITITTIPITSGIAAYSEL